MNRFIRPLILALAIGVSNFANSALAQTYNLNVPLRARTQQLVLGRL